MVLDRGRLPLIAIVFLLVLLLLIPVWVWQRTGQLRDHYTEVVVPAGNTLLEAQLAFASEVAAMRGFELTGDSAFLRQFRSDLARDRAASARLASLAERLDAQVNAALVEFEIRKEAWREEPLRFLAGEATRDELVATVPTGQRLLEAALAAAARVNRAVMRADAEARAQIRFEERAAWLLVALVSLGALTVALFVASLLRRLDLLTNELRHRVEDEASLHRLARTLSGAVSVQEVAQQVTGAAVSSTRAVGAYVERAENGVVEIIAGHGPGAPPPRTQVPYEDSLTAAAVGSAAPALHAEPSVVVRARAPYSDRDHSQGAGLVVPLVAEESVLGALVLLAAPNEVRFTESETLYARALGDLVTAALRRVLLLEREQQARAEAEAAVRHRDQVLRVVSHDLKNPLHTIDMVAQLLLEVPLSEEKRIAHLQIVRRTTGRMDRLVRDLLDASRLQSGRSMAIVRAPVDLAGILDEALETCWVQASEKNQRLDCHVDLGGRLVYADRPRLMQVLSNLLGNALKFTPEGGHIGVRAESEGEGAVRVSVVDTGPGISAEDVPHLFDPFWQSKDGAALGTGLGLAIARGIVEAHGGTISVDSSPGEGSTFTFTLLVASVPATVDRLDGAGGGLG
jgi:signal transduction histidine kinase